MKNASEFISRVIENNFNEISGREKYVDYIAKRPPVQKLETHGLFNGEDEKICLEDVKKDKYVIYRLNRDILEIIHT